MGKIIVDVISARNLHHEDGLLGKNDPYLSLRVHHFHSQKTKTHKAAGSTVDFHETFEFDAEAKDDLTIQMYDDDMLKDDKIGKATIPLRGVFETGCVESWYQIGEGSKARGEVLLKIRTQ